MCKFINKYFQADDGATAIEYTLIAAGIGLAIAVTVGLVGGDLNGFFVTLRTFL